MNDLTYLIIDPIDMNIAASGDFRGSARFLSVVMAMLSYPGQRKDHMNLFFFCHFCKNVVFSGCQIGLGFAHMGGKMTTASCRMISHPRSGLTVRSCRGCELVLLVG